MSSVDPSGGHRPSRRSGLRTGGTGKTLDVTVDGSGARQDPRTQASVIRPRQRWATDDGREARILLVRGDGVVLRDAFGWQRTVEPAELRRRWRLLAE